MTNSIKNSANSPKRGVYFIANDKIFDLTLAFLNSFRIKNPEIDLCLIPYDDQTKKIISLCETYSFSVYDNENILRGCDEIGAKFHDGRPGHYRKIAAWEGDFDEFIYIDCDTIVLEDVSFVYDFLPYFSFITSHSDQPHLRQWVWKKTIYGVGQLSWEQIRYSANTGFICSKKNALTIEEARQKLDAGLSLSPHMELMCMEQPYLNFLIVTSGKKYSSIRTIRNETGIHDMPIEEWAGISFFLWLKEYSRFRSHKTLLIHWAGEWQKTNFDNFLDRACKFFRLSPRSIGVRFFMRKRNIWMRFRKLDYSGTVREKQK